MTMLVRTSSTAEWEETDKYRTDRRECALRGAELCQLRRIADEEAAALEQAENDGYYDIGEPPVEDWYDDIYDLRGECE